MKERVLEIVQDIKELLNELAENDSTGREEIERQIEEVGNAITNLEKSMTPVPIELRDLKEKLTSELKSTPGSVDEALGFFLTEISSLKPKNKPKLQKVIFDDEIITVPPSARAGRRR